jgi:cytosine/adenosine deaminase-related metal-dependent hydrolase
MKQQVSLNDSAIDRNHRIRATWLVTGVAEPMRGGCVVVRGKRIIDVEERALGPIDIELEDAVLMPGLINSHTHLEFSGLSSPLSAEGGFVEWVRKVIAYRQERWGDFASPLQIERRRLDLQSGLEEAVRCGTAALADIATHPYPIPEALDSATTQPVMLWGLGEVLGWTEQRRQEMRLAFNGMREQAEAYCAVPLPAGNNVEQRGNDRSDDNNHDGCIDYRWGISPHAPYSTSPRVIQWCIEQSRLSKQVLAMHVGETLEEMEWLATRTGVFADLLEHIGVGKIPELPQWKTARDYLNHLSRAWRALVVHGNYLGTEDWELLARHREKMSVVYCPRTHQHFGHKRYPLFAMRQAGVRVILGTDSRASNPDLSMWEELRTVAAGGSGLNGQEILGMATTEAAAGLGIANELGSIESGKLARFSLANILKPGHLTVSPKLIWEHLWDSRDVALPQSFGL